MHAADRAAWSAALLRQELALHVLGRVLRQRNAGMAALLAAVVHQPILADVQVPTASTAAPVIGLAVRNGFLKMIEPAVAAPRHGTYGVPYLALSIAQRLQLSRAVVNDADGRAEAHRKRPLADDARVI